MNLSVRVTNHGSISAEDMRHGREVTKTLSIGDSQELERLLAAATLGGSADAPSACADCFLYDLDIKRFGQSTRWRGDDTTLDASGMADLIRLLIKLRDEALSGGI